MAALLSGKVAGQSVLSVLWVHRGRPLLSLVHVFHGAMGVFNQQCHLPVLDPWSDGKDKSDFRKAVRESKLHHELHQYGDQM